MLKDHGVRAHAEGLKQTKDAKKKQRVVIQACKDKRMANINLVSSQLCTGPNS